MTKKSKDRYNKYNLRREKCGLPTVSRRDFVRLLGLASAGLSIPLMESCDTNSNNSDPGELPGAGIPQSGQGESGTLTGGSYGNAGGQLADGSGGSDPSGTSGSGGTVGQGGTAGTNDIGTGGFSDRAAGGPSDSGLGGTSGQGAAGGPPDTTNPDYTCPTCAHVGISRNADITAAVRTAVGLAGGLSAIKQGDTVVIKPNITGFSEGFVTHPSVVRGIIETVADYTDMKNITVAECTALGANTKANAIQSGILPVVEEVGANFKAFDEAPEGYVLFSDPQWSHLTDEKNVPRSLTDGTFTHFINAPIIKNHTMGNAVYTCCFKNFVGIIPYTGPGSRWIQSIHTLDLAQKAAELGRIVPQITMNIVDATTPGLVGGPTPTTIANAGGLIVASADRVACDTVALAVLRCYARTMNVLTASYLNTSVFAQAQVVRGAEIGLGVNDPANIEIIDKDVDNIAEIKAEWV